MNWRPDECTLGLLLVRLPVLHFGDSTGRLGSQSQGPSVGLLVGRLGFRMDCN
jgi:hypothetical protein